MHNFSLEIDRSARIRIFFSLAALIIKDSLHANGTLVSISASIFQNRIEKKSIMQ